VLLSNYFRLVHLFAPYSVMSQHVVVVIPLKLDGPNYREWAFSVKPSVLSGYSSKLR
jgi:hypothetical protein